MGVQGDVKATLNRPNLVSCTVSRYFWLGIDDGGALAVGEGSVPFQKLLMSWKDEESPVLVSAISIATGPGQTGTWEFPQVNGQLSHAWWVRRALKILL